MQKLEYMEFDRVDEKEFIELLNRQKIREHLIEHDAFDEHSIRNWIDSKLEMDSVPGCRVRAICCGDKLIGWCGIQLESEKFEIAVVLDESAWGNGKRVFADIMKWAKEFGHENVYINLLHTRRENRFLKRMAEKVFYSEMFGNKFTTYQLAVK